jgi:hypothetical protein
MAGAVKEGPLFGGPRLTGANCIDLLWHLEFSDGGLAR